MTGLNVSMAPGCYGMGMLFRDGSAECSTCPFAASCKPIGEQQLAMLRAELGVVVRERPAPEPVREARPGSAVMTLTDGLPKKVAAWIGYIEREGIKVNEALASQTNPFTGKRPNFLNIACQLLLKCPKGVNRDMLSYAFTTKLNWSKETASSHITQTKQILAALGAIDDVDGLMQLRAP
jgi:hypothetical protein